MATLAFLMNFISDAYQIDVSPEFKVFIHDYSHCKLTSDIYTFKFFIVDNELLTNEEKQDVEDLYLVSKMLKNTFKKYLRLKKINKLEPKNSEDLYFNNFEDFPLYQRTNLICQGTLYRFRLSNIVNMWLKCLKNTDNLFTKPIQLKNPYTNMPFKEHNLYNIYIGLANSKYQIPFLIREFIKHHCNLNIFTLETYPTLKDHAINNFVYTAHTFELMEQINNMMYEFRKKINYIYFPENVSYTRKKKIVRLLKHILKDYLYGTYGCNPLKKIDAYSQSKTKLKDFFRDNPFEDFTLQNIPPRPSLPPPPPPAAQRNRRTSILDYSTPSIAFNLPPPPFNSDDPFVPLSVQEIVNNITQNIENTTNTRNTRNTRNSSSSIRPYSLQLNAFAPNRELPRTPPNNSTPPENSTPSNSNVRPFSLRLFQ